MENIETNNRKKSKAKIFIFGGIGLFILLIGALLITIVALFSDKRRSTSDGTDIEYAEIIKKNFVKGFENTENTGKFSFILEKDDINNLLYKTTKSINNEYIDAIYYDVDGDDNYFYVDLNKTFIKTRITVKTTRVASNGLTSQLVVKECKLGKVNGLNLLKKHGYLKASFMNDLFKSANLPISFDEENYIFNINPLKMIDSFPSISISTTFFNLAKQKAGCLSLNNSPFGFDVDFSKLVADNAYTAVDTSSNPNLYNDLNTGVETRGAELLSSSDTTATAYSISNDILTKVFTKAVPTNIVEEISSELAGKTAKFSLVGAKTDMSQAAKIKLKLFYSINGYLVDVNTELNVTDNIGIYYDIYFETALKVDVGPLSFTGSENEFVKFFINNLTSIEAMVASQNSEFFAYDALTKSLTVKLEDMNNNHANPAIKMLTKNAVVNTTAQSLDFIITK